MNRAKKKVSHTKKQEVLKETGAPRQPEFETPSQRRNRDGEGRGPNGSDGSGNRGRGSNH
jgi:hypothetical protein